MKGKSFSIIGIIIIFLVLVGGGYFTWQYSGEKKEEVKKSEQEQKQVVVDETVDWEVYKNEEYGFEIKYPKNWEVLINDPYGQKYPSFRNKKYEGSWEWPGLNIVWPLVYGTEAPITESRIFRLEDASNEVITISITEKDKTIVASCALYFAPETIDICNQMLSTFRFLE
jgi:hypothetical protein